MTRADETPPQPCTETLYRSTTLVLNARRGPDQYYATKWSIADEYQSGSKANCPAVAAPLHLRGEPPLQTILATASSPARSRFGRIVGDSDGADVPRPDRDREA